MKRIMSRKHLNILLCALLAVCLLCFGTVLGKYVVERTLGTIDLSISGGVPTGNFTLKRGSDFSSDISGLFYSTEETVTELQFGSWEEYGSKYSLKWSEGTDVGVDAGTIKAFANGTTVYILSGGDMFANSNCRSMFAYMSSLTAIKGLDAVDTSNVTDMSYMFDDCEALESVDLSGFDTSNVTNMSYMFYGTGITTLDLSSFDTSNVTDMEHMFTYSTKLQSLDLSNFNTEKVEDMQSMFRWCHDLASLNVSSFDTSKVTNMSRMFEECRSLTSLNVSNFNTALVTDMMQMFNECSSLTELNLSSFDTGQVTDMSSMFSSSTALVDLDLSSFNTSNVTDMYNMFGSCNALIELDLSSFNTSKVTKMESMFSRDSSLRVIWVSNLWTTGAVTDNGDGMFTDCKLLVGSQGTAYSSDNTHVNYAHIDGGTSNPGYLSNSSTRTTYTLLAGTSFNNAIRNMFSEDVTKLRFGSFNTYGKANGLTWSNSGTYVDSANAGTIRVFTSGDTVYVLSQDSSRIKLNASCAYMFKGWNNDGNGDTTLRYNLKEIRGLNLVDTSGVTNMSYMFYYAEALTSVNISDFDTSKVTTMHRMFYSAQALESLDLSNWNTGNVMDMGYMFYYCYGLTTLDASGWNASKVTAMDFMFYECKALTSLDVSGWNTTNVKTMAGMFCGCQYLKELDVTSFDTSNVTSMGRMFHNCLRLESLDVSGFKTGNVTNMSHMFAGCFELTEQDFSGWDTSKVGNMQYMFFRCYDMPSLDLRSFNTSNVENMGYMFGECTVITSINVSSFDTRKVTNMEQMFSYCSALTTLDLSSFDTSRVTNMKNMFFQYSTNSTRPGQLKTIYVSESWKTSALTDSTLSMFGNCNQLVGGAGTKFDAAHVDSTYAHIDGGTSNPGYLTLKSGDIPIGNFTLVDGGTFRESVSDLNGNASKIQFGAWSEFGTANGLAWSDGVDVSDGSSGGIKAFSKNGTVYILSGGKIFANASCEAMFQQLTATEIAGFENVDTSNVTSMYCMFMFCEKLVSVNLSNLNTSNVTDMGYMFGQCSALKTLDLSSFDTSKVEYMDMMFYGCSNLTTIYAGDKWTTASNNGMMFRDCSSIKGGAGTTYNANYVDGTYARIDGGTSNPGYFTAK